MSKNTEIPCTTLPLPPRTFKLGIDHVEKFILQMDMVMYIYNHLSVTNIKQRRILTMGIFKSSSRKLLLFSLLLSCLYSCCRSQTLTDTIKPGDTLGPTDTLTSENGRFILKFFNFSDNGYLGIWIGNNKAVWIANGSVPLVRTGNLTMDADGVLTVMDNGGNKFALNPSFASPSSTATLQNSGNFVVTELNADGSTKQILWQSFDYPTDTLLPGMKLGVNHKTGQTWRVTSWLIDQLPGGGGGFSLDWNSTGTGELVIRRLGQVYWNSGAITSDAVQNLPQLSSNANKPTFTVVSNDDESSFSYAVAEGSTSWWVLSPTGDLTNFEDGIGQFLLLEGACDGAETADTNLGCVKQDVPECRSSDEAFDRIAGVFSGQGQPWAFGSTSIGPVDCWKTCWTNCSCIGYDVIYSNQTWCRIWNVSAIFTRNESGDQSAIHVLSSLSKSKDNKWWIWVVVSVAAVLLALISTFLWYLRRKKLQREEEEALFELAPTDRLGDVNEIGNDGKKGHDLKVFTFSTITAATDNFSSRNKLGQGGFGPVYKGKLPEGQEIAVKRLSRSSGQGLEEFKNELILIAKLQHMNLVRLIGCCVKGDEKMLVYEFMPNKSLDFFLFDPTKREILDWKRRFNIIEGTAQGILYLHKYSRLRIIHRDLKASNILLDKDMQPKISDFGMARIFGRNESEANTNRVVGTYGYMSPEYAMEGNFSEKSDVYSFGVLLLEIASGRKNSSGFQYNDRPLNLVGYAFELWRQGKSLELMDPMLAGSKSIPQIQRCIHVGLLCVQEFAADRPTMSEVVAMLTNDTVPLPMPNQAASAPTAHKISELSLAESERESCSIKMSDVQDMAPR